LNFERCVSDAFRGGALREMGGGHIHVEFADIVALKKIFIILLIYFYK